MLTDPAAAVRAARRFADMSQRELAAKAKVAVSTVTRIESGRLQPSLTVVLTLLAAAGCHLQVHRSDGKPLRDVADGKLRDRQGRRYPPHLDVVLPRIWPYGTQPPGLRRAPATYHRNRHLRDRKRTRGHLDPRMLPSPWD